MLLAALPATPVQLAHACYQLGFEVVVPASWGDELVSQAVLEDLRHRDREPVIQCTCPLVFERLLANGQHLLPSMVQTASPAVAAARYSRQAFAPRSLNITYVGACPGARHSSIDERCVPDELLRSLAEHDISIADMPTVFDSVLPPDRRRFVSLPGGCPTQEALWQASDGRMLREVTQPTFSTDLAQTLVWREHVMVDVAPSLGCACAGSCSRLGARSGRVAVMAVEPPRATQPVVNFKPDYAAPPMQAPMATEMGNGDTPRAPTARPHEGAEAIAPAAIDRAPDAAGAAVSRARVRVRTTTPLPRAYLAKRRHIASGAAALEAAPPNEAQPSAFETYVRPQHDVAPEQAVANVAPEPAVVSSEVSAILPNETPVEPIDVSRSIAVHVEPEPLKSEVVSAQQVQVADVTAQMEVPLDVQGLLLLEDSPSPENVATATLNDVEECAPPTDIPVAVEEPVVVEEAVEELPPPVEERRGPLRVEVEIFEEAEPAPQEAEVVIPDAVLSDASLKVTSPEPEIPVEPRRAWGDFLIALWLVLVASAVIAALLWRG